MEDLQQPLSTQQRVVFQLTGPFQRPQILGLVINRDDIFAPHGTISNMYPYHGVWLLPFVLSLNRHWPLLPYPPILAHVRHRQQMLQVPSH